MPDRMPAGVTALYHTPVLLEESLALIGPVPGAAILDATVGGGGHSAALAARIAPGGILIGLDRDTEAIEAARSRLSYSDVRTTLVHTSFGDIPAALAALEGGDSIRLDGVIFDLGVSSHQLDTARGFTFRRDEPLDMRMDGSDPSGQTAAHLLLSSDEADLARILWEYGDEKWSRRIARRIVERRSRGERLETTAQLAALIEQSIPRAAWPRDIHVATRTFQALRIAVNDELGQLRAGLDAAFERLAPDGRLVVISYHSLEDRIVKQMFAAWAGRTPSAPGSSPAALMPAPAKPPAATLLTRKPVVPTDAETARNPRARSAKLRALVKNG
jgi:16S rRNA (cytosine1402-N4)-methyltransferase